MYLSLSPAAHQPLNQICKLMAGNDARARLTNDVILSVNPKIWVLKCINYIKCIFYLRKLDVSLISIAGPVPLTFADFWQMIWEQNTRTIVMLTNLKEGSKVRVFIINLVKGTKRIHLFMFINYDYLFSYNMYKVTQYFFVQRPSVTSIGQRVKKRIETLQ